MGYVVTLRETAESILYEFHKGNCDSSEDVKQNITKIAAKMIESDIRSILNQSNDYPSVDLIANKEANLDYIPNTLRLLLQIMFSGKSKEVKVASIGQAIMQGVRPRALLTPLQLGLGVQMHHHFASRFLIDSLNELGFSCSYAEVLRYERSAAVTEGTELSGLSENHHIQFVADNVDHNVATLD